MIRRLRDQTVRALRWSEKYTKTDMVYLARGGFWLFYSQAAVAITSFILAIAFANLLPKETYGVYKYLLTVLGILTVACLRGMDSIVTQASARGKDGTVLQALSAKIRWGTIGSLASVGVALYYYLNGNVELAIGFVVAAIFIPIMDPFGIYSSVLTGKKDFKLGALFDSGGQVVAGVALIGALFATRNAIIIFATYCAAWTAVRLFSFFGTLKKYPPNAQVEPGGMSYGKHASFINSSAVMIASLDMILVFHYLGSANLAVYSFAMAPILQLRGVLNILSTLSIPKFAAQTSNAIRRMLVQRSVTLFLAGTGITLFYIALAPLFYRTFFPQYLNAVLFSQVFAVTIVFSLGTTLVGSVLNSRVTLIPKPYLYLWSIPSVVLGVSSIAFIQAFGIWGAVAGQILATATSTTLSWFLWYKIRYKEFTPSVSSERA